MSITPTDRVLIISIADQKMAAVKGSTMERLFQISTSKNPPSCVADSYGTPTGLHELADFIGDSAPVGMVFKGRVATGKHFSEYSAEEQAGNLITTRILRLRGLEHGKNAGDGCDSYQRYIYIHGSNHEERIGEPFSGGCVEMLNADVIELFNWAESGDLVWICDGE